MKEIHVRFSFGDLLYLWQCLRCLRTHRRLSCLREGLREKRLQLTGGDPTWEPFTVGDWIELRRWRNWAGREHEREPEPTPWRHERTSTTLPRPPASQEYTKPRRSPGRYRRCLVWPGLSCIAIGGGALAGVLLYDGHKLAGLVLIFTGAVLSTVVLRYVGKVD